MADDSAMEGLEAFCEEKGITLVIKKSTYKYTSLYWEKLKILILYQNASFDDIASIHALI